jgi:hopanoid biosynthesis associated RND transporter like protein HpnN
MSHHPLALTTGWCARRPLTILLAALTLAAASIFLAATRLGMSTDLHSLFDPTLPWVEQDEAARRAFPQFHDIIVAVIDARIPEEADATASALTAALAPDSTHFIAVTRPDSSPYLAREGLLFLPTPTLTALLDKTVDAAPFLGQLAADPFARGLFNALGLIGLGVTHGQADLTAFKPALLAFHATLQSALAGNPTPLSWQSLLAGNLANLAGPNRIVLIRPRLNYAAVQPGGAATALIREAAARLPFVANGDAHVRLTGDVPLADDEFASAAHGALAALLISFALVVLWLYLALRSWRLIAPVVATLVLGLILTTGFAALAVGTLNLISVAFAVLFIGIAVDFSIQFALRFRESRLATPTLQSALSRTGRLVGRQVLVAALATAAGFLAFVPTSFRGVAELGLIAGIGMLIALVCTLTFLPAALALCQPAAMAREPGIAALAPADRALTRLRTPILAAFTCLLAAGLACATRLTFDSNTLHTKSQTSEAMQTLLHLLDSPLTNPFTASIMRPTIAQADAMAGPIGRLPLVDHVVGLQSFVPTDQTAKLAAIADASSILAPILAAQAPATPPSLPATRAAIGAALAKLRPALVRLRATDPLALITADLAALQAAPDETLRAAAGALSEFLPLQLDRLRASLTAGPATLADIPESIRRDYIAPDGAVRLQIVPKRDVADSRVLRRFADEVRAIAPDAGGPAITIVSTADTIIAAFRQAAFGAVLAITIILLIALRRPLHVLLVLVPLLISAAITVLIITLAGITLNYANIIALPLLLGVGVSFNIYFVMNWRAGCGPSLTSATTRAVIFSALTTGTAFGSLAISAHPGTASMGTLLLTSLACTLITSLVFVPALLKTIGQAALAPRPVGWAGPQPIVPPITLKKNVLF